MQVKRLFLLSLIPLALLGIPLAEQDPSPSFIRLYKQAEALYNKEEPTEKDDSIALSIYENLIAQLKERTDHDSILWDSYFKASIFYQTYGRYEKALPLLLSCLLLEKKLPQVPLSAWFLPNLYTGNTYYLLNRYDSARYFYKKAESIALQNNNVEGLERLHNAFGILNYETGNYNQSKNNFEKAISLLRSKKDMPIPLLVNYQNNLASALRKLYRYNESMHIYQSLLAYGMNLDEINQNIASIYLAKDSAANALPYLQSVKKPKPVTFNNLGLAYYKMNRYDSAQWHLDRALLLNEEENGRQKNIQAGLSYCNLGKLNAAKKDYKKAIEFYQLALQQLFPSFNDSSSTSNPVDFTGAFAVFELYETLLSKANAFSDKYVLSNNIDDIANALSCFQSLYLLTDYVEKTYESDEARIFLNQKKHESHNLPIGLCLQLYALTGEIKYLEQAFYFDERNKASVLSTGLSEKELKRASDIPANLLDAESNCKEAINSLSLKASRTVDSVIVGELSSQLRDQQLKLESLHKQLIEYPSYRQWKLSDKIMRVEDLQKEIASKKRIVISYHVGDTSLLCWLISHNGFEFVTTAINDSLNHHINSLYKAVQLTSSFSTSANREHIRYLYKILIQPIEKKIEGYEELLIVPDDELNYLPFEMLTDADDEFLVQKFSITYNYSCSLLKNQPGESGKRDMHSILGFTPFAEANPSLDATGFSLLPGSAKEVEGLEGKLLSGKQALKDSFIQLSPGYNILHLATHAQANDSLPIQSFIAFFPSKTDSITNSRMYLPEIYNLKLSNTRLTILSACETGSGRLIKGEGIISLARAFSYAGCPNMITSQWKADDLSTAYILHRVHHYLQKDMPVAKALAKAKRDYLDDSSIDGRKKTPAFFAHLRFTGQLETAGQTFNAWWLLAIPVLLIVYLFIKKTAAPTGDRQSHS